MENKLSPNLKFTCSSCDDLNLDMDTNIKVSLPETSMKITSLKEKNQKRNSKQNTLF